MNSITTAFIDPKKRSEIYVDGSPVGLGAIPVQIDGNQQNRLTTFVSCTLTDIERR
jgi:RNase H-like domain found in reverse transcriptase